MVTVIIGVGVMSMLELLAAGTASNSDSAETATAITLANNIRELSMGLAFYDPTPVPVGTPRAWDTKEATLAEYDNVMDLDGTVDNWNNPNDPVQGYLQISPPINGTRQAIGGLTGWAQWVKVETVSSDNLQTLLPQDPNTEVVRVTVKIVRNGAEVYRASWIASSAPK